MAKDTTPLEEFRRVTATTMRAISKKDVNVSFVPDGGSLLLCLTESPLARRAESRWRQTDAELRCLLESVEPAVILYDTAGRVRASSGRRRFFAASSGCPTTTSMSSTSARITRTRRRCRATSFFACG